MFVTQTAEHQLLVDARENFRAQGLLRPRQDVAFQCRVVGMLQAHQFRRADVGSEPDIKPAEIQRLAGRHRDARGIQQLQQDVQHARMRLFRFVKQQRSFRRAFAHRAQITSFAKPRAEQQAERFLLLKFRHVEAEQFSRAENLVRQHDDRFRFADARRSEQQKTSARTARLGQAQFAALHHRDDARQHLGLAANFVRQQRVQFRGVWSSFVESDVSYSSPPS